MDWKEISSCQDVECIFPAALLRPPADQAVG